MKSFYTSSANASTGAVVPSLCCARVAIYEAPAAAPRVVEVGPFPVGDFIDSLASRVHELATSAGGTIPYTVIREVSENLIHADFREPVVSIMDKGRTVRFADQGPGISDKDRAQLPGFTTARNEMKAFIRGVGSGLPLVKDYLAVSGGVLAIEDNLGSGVVVTVSADARTPLTLARRTPAGTPRLPSGGGEPTDELFPSQAPRLNTRQKQVLALVMESGNAGPSLVSRELGVGLSTAYRDLAVLEELDLIRSHNGKRAVTEDGRAFFGEPAEGR